MILYTNKHKIPFEIDEDDQEIVSYFTWYISRGYVMTNVRRNHAGNKGTLALHLILLGPAPEELEWDHKDRDKLNNRRENLRLVTKQVNNFNRCLQINNTSGHKGIYENIHGFYRVLMSIGHKSIYIGTFKTLEEAIEKRREAENAYWGKII